MSVWAALLLTVLAALGTRAVVALAALVRTLGQGLPFEEALGRVALDPLTLALAQLGTVVPIVLFARTRYAPNRSLRNVLGLHPVPPAVWLLSLVAGLCLHFPLAEVENLLRELLPLSLDEQLRLRRFLEPRSLFHGFATVFALCFVAPVLEELLFRGVILTGVQRRHGGRVALLVSALLFGLSHFEPVVAVYAVLAGLVLAALTLRVRSVVPAIGVHVGVNAVPVLALPSVIRIDGLNTISEEVYHLPVLLVIGSGVASALCLLGVMHLCEEAA